MFRWVEQPAPTWMQALRWQAGMLGLGLLVLQVEALW